MSTRFYPIYQRGNPQLRIFLPNFWLKLIKPTHEQPPNVVQFSCSMEMTKYDVKNYLEKIYKIPVVDVRTRIDLGKTKRDHTVGYITKNDDMKLAYVTLVIILIINMKILILIRIFSYSLKISNLSFQTFSRKTLKLKSREKMTKNL